MMTKPRRALAAAVLAALLCSLFPFASAAETGDFYITNFDVAVAANSDRSYDIRETISVCFTDDSHGIYREIPTSGSVENCTLENLNVEGDPFTIDDDGSIRIGDADTTISGPKTYVITYTLRHNADPDPAYDYLYLNLIGTGWGEQIDNYSASITLPSGASASGISLTSGSSGSTEKPDASVVSDGELITVKGNSGLDPYCGLTILVTMDEGAFSDAPKAVPDFTVHDMDYVLTLAADGSADVTERYSVTLNENGAEFRRRIFSASYDTMPVKVDGKICLDDGSGEKYYDGDTAYFPIDAAAGDTVSFTLSYRLAFRTSDQSLQYSLRPISCFDYVFESASIRVVSPDRPLAASVSASATELFDVDLQDQGFTASLSRPYTLSYVDIFFTMPDGAVTASFSASDAALLIFSLLALAAAVVLFFTRGKAVKTGEIYYPPDGLNPAEVAYVLDGGTSAVRQTSLIYYWASHGHLAISFKDADHFTLLKRTELDQAHPAYERELYASLWELGENGSVSDSDGGKADQPAHTYDFNARANSGTDGTATSIGSVEGVELCNSFYKAIDTANSDMRAEFTGDRALDDKKRKWIYRIATILLPFAALLFTYFTAAVSVYGGDASASGLIAAVFFLTAFFAAGGFLLNASKSRKLLKKLLLCASAAALLILGAVLLSTSYACVCLGGVMAVSSIALCAAELLLVFSFGHTPYGQRICAESLAFRKFLSSADRDRITSLLQSNGRYTYDVLPYCVALGLASEWESRFAPLLGAQPDWFVTEGESTRFLYSTSYLVSSISSMTNTASHSPVSYTSSSSSDSGGGFSGGGSSGGGSGGGGGGGW